MKLARADKIPESWWARVAAAAAAKRTDVSIPKNLDNNQDQEEKEETASQPTTVPEDIKQVTHEGKRKKRSGQTGQTGQTRNVDQPANPSKGPSKGSSSKEPKVKTKDKAIQKGVSGTEQASSAKAKSSRDDFDEWKYPRYILEMPHRSIWRELEIQCLRVHSHGPGINLQELMESVSATGGPKYMELEKRTGCRITFNLTLKTVYLGADSAERLGQTVEILDNMVASFVSFLLVL